MRLVRRQLRPRKFPRVTAAADGAGLGRGGAHLKQTDVDI